MLAGPSYSVYYLLVIMLCLNYFSCSLLYDYLTGTRGKIWAFSLKWNLFNYFFVCFYGLAPIESWPLIIFLRRNENEEQFWKKNWKKFKKNKKIFKKIITKEWKSRVFNQAKQVLNLKTFSKRTHSSYLSKRGKKV